MMSPDDHPTVREVYAIVREHDRRYNDLREADQRSTDEYRREVQRALDLAKSNADRTAAMVVSMIALVVALAAAIFTYVK